MPGQGKKRPASGTRSMRSKGSPSTFEKDRSRSDRSFSRSLSPKPKQKKKSTKRTLESDSNNNATLAGSARRNLQQLADQLDSDVFDDRVDVGVDPRED